MCVASSLIAASLCKQLNRPGTAVRRHASYADEAVKQVYKSTNWKTAEKWKVVSVRRLMGFSNIYP